MNEQIIRKRVRTIRGQLDKKNIDCLIVTKPANVTYITGFLGEDSWAVIAPRAVYFLTDSRYIEQAQKECLHCRIIQRSGQMSEAVGKLIKKLKSLQTIAVEESTSLADFGQLRKNIKGRLRSVASVVESVRRSKDSSEITAIKSAARVATQALKRTAQRMKPGTTESELSAMLDFQIHKVGARNSFETIVAFGPNASRPHHQPGRTKLKKNGTVLIDFGAKYKGYCCDITRCFVLGKPTAFYQEAYDVVQKAQAAAIKTIKAGAEMIRVDAAARDVIRKSGLPVYGHGTGHGLGLEIHEQPFLARESKGKLQAGMVLTIEPGIYIPGKLGVRIEDDILVTERGCKVLTRNCPHSPFLPN